MAYRKSCLYDIAKRRELVAVAERLCGVWKVYSSLDDNTFYFSASKIRSTSWLGFFYFTFNDKSKQDESAMLRALLVQMSSQFQDGHRDLIHLNKTYRPSTPPIRLCGHRIEMYKTGDLCGRLALQGYQVHRTVCRIVLTPCTVYLHRSTESNTSITDAASVSSAVSSKVRPCLRRVRCT